MKTKSKKTDDGRVLIQAIASVEEVGRAFDNAQLMFAQQMNLRPQGNLSIAAVVEKELGIKDLDAVLSPQALEYLVPFAIEEVGITPAIQAEITGESTIRRGTACEFSISVIEKPSYHLSSYDPVSITVAPFEYNQEEIEAELSQIAERYTEYVADDPHPVDQGDNCLLKIEASQNGQPMSGLTTEGRTYTAGIGHMPPEFDTNIIGMDVGETKSFSFEGPGLDSEGNETVEKVDCTVTVLEIQKKRLPEINDEWVSQHMPMFKDAAELRSNIEEQVVARNRAGYEDYLRQVAAAELAQRFEGKIADELYEATQQSLLDNLRAQLKQQGVTLDQYIKQNGGEQQFQYAVMMQTRQTLIQGFSLDALFRHEKMKLSDDDIHKASMSLNRNNPEMARKQLEQSGRGFVLREIAERLKANQWLLDHAEITIKEQN